MNWRTTSPTYQYRRAPYMARGEELAELLPAPLSERELSEIISAGVRVAGKVFHEVDSEETYSYKDLSFRVPSGVIFPGESSALLFDYIDSGRIPLRGKGYLALGVGTGVELVLAARQGATAIYSSDIHKESVEIAKLNYFANTSEDAHPPLSSFVSDLLSDITVQAPIEVLSFNAPAGLCSAANEDLKRMAYSGPQIMERLFRQLAEIENFSSVESVYSVLSNTTDMARVVTAASRHGFRADVLELVTTQPGHRYEKIQTHLFHFERIH